MIGAMKSIGRRFIQMNNYKTFNISRCVNLLGQNIPKKFYFSYPCPRKLREIVHMSLFEKENAPQIKEIWKLHYDGKPNAMGLDIDPDEMKVIIEK